jgi:hypothetical protein
VRNIFHCLFTWCYLTLLESTCFISSDNRKLLMLSYIDPEVSSLDPSIFPIFGTGLKVTVKGNNFGLYKNVRTTVFIGNTPCASTMYISDKELVCVLPSIANESQEAALIKYVTVSVPQGTCSRYFSNSREEGPSITFTRISIESLEPEHGPLRGNTLVKIIGKDLGSHKLKAKPSIFFGGSECVVKDWSDDDTFLTCHTSPSLSGHGPADMSISIGHYVQHDVHCYTYDHPLVSRLEPSVGPLFGGNKVLIHGYGFGEKDNKEVKVVFGRSICQDIEVLSDELIECKYAPSSVMAEQVPVRVVTFGEYVDSIEFDDKKAPLLYSYSHPSLTKVLPASVPFYGNTTLTFVGEHMGNENLHTEVFVGEEQCLDVKHLDENQISCIAPPQGACGDLQVFTSSAGIMSVDGKYSAATLPAILPDGKPLVIKSLCPTITSVRPTHAAAGATISIFGQLLGADGLTTRAFIGGMECVQTVFISANEVKCEVPDGAGNRLKVLVSVEGNEADSLLESEAVFTYASSTRASFSYNQPFIVDINPKVGPIYGGNTIRVKGQNLGASVVNGAVRGATPVLFIGGDPCLATRYVDVSTIVCLVAPSYKERITDEMVKVKVTLMVGGEFVHGELDYSYEAVVLTSVSPSRGPIYGNFSL